jgi:peptidoglycan/xylan/chitin deacetylase (PgdA/CDA1 family)
VKVEGRRWDDTGVVTRLKQVPDRERRGYVHELAGELERHLGRPVSTRQITMDQLHRWEAGGHEIGNHTWDHPCLDRCDEAEQVRQVERADAWLSGFSRPVKLFAYPNGNWSATVDAALVRLGYSVACLFDHSLAGLDQPLRVSRLRVAADADLDRFRSVVSGLHSGAFGLGGRLRTRSQGLALSGPRAEAS